MFRNDFSDVSLFGAQTMAAGPKPSFRPAVEALEERLVLDNSLAIAQLNQLTALVTALNVSLQKSVKHSLDSDAALKHAERQALVFDKLDRLIAQEAVTVINAVDESAQDLDQVTQALTQLTGAVGTLRAQIFIAEHHHRPPPSSSPLPGFDFSGISFSELAPFNFLGLA